MRSPWAREYVRTPRRYIWGTEPSELARDVVRLLPARARVVELGSGEGRDSVFFAARGFDVIGVELSRAGIDKAERLARAHEVPVRWVHGDMARGRFGGPFHLVYSCGAIHYVPRQARVRLFRRLKSVTVPDGYHAHIVFTAESVYVEKGELIDYFGAGELREAYHDWRVIDHEHGMISCAADGLLHQHSVERLIAQRPTTLTRGLA
ncbi:MAG: class I SAM-dependent methyltransferase [Candidatus Rokubacteria bacterium]|nr:class I SAM-dependent methyltransferase [Candidatus Rokubacteria bacterium]